MTHCVEHVNGAIVGAGLGIQPAGNGKKRNLEIAALVSFTHQRGGVLGGVRVTRRGGAPTRVETSGGGSWIRLEASLSIFS